MKLSTKCRYGVRAVVEIAKNYGKKPMKRKDIVDNQMLTGSYLENILITLKNNNIVIAVRGVNGGFLLKRPPETITVLEVVESLQGTLTPVDCLLEGTVCELMETCLTRPVWRKLKDAQAEVLSNITIQNLLDQEKENQPLNFDI